MTDQTEFDTRIRVTRRRQMFNFARIALLVVVAFVWLQLFAMIGHDYAIALDRCQDGVIIRAVDPHNVFYPINLCLR